MLTKIQPKSYTEMFFDMIESADDQTGKITYKLPKETMEKLEQLCRLESGKTRDGKDKRLSLAERLEAAKKDVSYYQEQLKDTSRWKLNDLSFFEFRLEEEKANLEKLKRREHWLKNARQEKNVDIEALKQGHDLVEVAESYGLNLRKRGQEYWALCPFHQEKTPSFSINQQKQQYYCFGCQEHGDLIGFIQKIEGCDFKEALEVLK